MVVPLGWPFMVREEAGRRDGFEAPTTRLCSVPVVARVRQGTAFACPRYYAFTTLSAETEWLDVADEVE